MIAGLRGIGLSAILSAALGAVTAFSFAPFYISWLPILTFAGLILLWQNAPGKWHATLLGLAFGLGFFCTGVNWIYVSLNDFGGMPALLAVFCTFLLSLILAAYAVAVGFLQALVRTRRPLHAVLVIPALWTLFEWLRGWLMTGFPWLSLGYAQAPDGLLAGYAPLLGVYGVSLVTTVSAGLVVCVLNAIAGRRSSVTMLVVVLAIIVVSSFALFRHDWTEPLGSPVSVSLVQGNITQDIKWKPETLASTLTTYRDLTLASKSKLIILPETAFPVFLEQMPEEYLAEFDNHAKKLGGDLLIGVPETTGPATYHNSVVSFGRTWPALLIVFGLFKFFEHAGRKVE